MNKMKDSVHADGELTIQYVERGKALKKYLGPYRLNIGLNPDSKQEKRLMCSQMRKI